MTNASFGGDLDLTEFEHHPALYFVESKEATREELIRDGFEVSFYAKGTDDAVDMRFEYPHDCLIVVVEGPIVFRIPDHEFFLLKRGDGFTVPAHCRGELLAIQGYKAEYFHCRRD